MRSGYVNGNNEVVFAWFEKCYGILSLLVSEIVTDRINNIVSSCEVSNMK